MCFTEGLGSLEVSHKFLGWFPRHLPHFNQPSFLYFVYLGTLHKIALEKKVLYFEGLHFFCFSTTAQVTVNESCSLMLWCFFFFNGLNYSPLDRTFHLFSRVSLWSMGPTWGSRPCPSLQFMALFTFAISKQHKCQSCFMAWKSKGPYEIIYQTLTLIQRLADC